MNINISLDLELVEGLRNQFTRTVQQFNLNAIEEICYKIFDSNINSMDLHTCVDSLYNIIMPIDLVCKRHNISKKNYLVLYCKDADVMNIRKRKEVLEMILNGDLEKVKFGE